jgi:hypothetical protein
MEDQVRLSIMIALIALLALVVAVPTVFAQPQGREPNPKAPQDVSVTFPPEFVATFPGSCDFPLQIVLSGKAKEIQLPNGGLLITSPGLDATLTNFTDPDAVNPPSVTFNVTGSTVTSTDPETGDVTTVARGRNLLIDPVAGTVIAIGNFSFVSNSDGTVAEPLEGEGQLIDVCALLA